jgi:hypothetical protein
LGPINSIACGGNPIDLKAKGLQWRKGWYVEGGFIGGIHGKTLIFIIGILEYFYYF